MCEINTDMIHEPPLWLHCFIGCAVNRYSLAYTRTPNKVALELRWTMTLMQSPIT